MESDFFRIIEIRRS